MINSINVGYIYRHRRLYTNKGYSDVENKLNIKQSTLYERIRRGIGSIKVLTKIRRTKR